MESGGEKDQEAKEGRSSPLEKDATHHSGKTCPTAAQGPKNGGGHHRPPSRQQLTSSCDEVDGIEKTSLLADKIRSVIGDTARVRLPEPRTPVLLLGIPEWVEVEEVIGLVRAEITGITAGDVRIKKNAGGRGEYVASLTLPLKDAIQLAETKAVVIGWTKCRVKLIEKKPAHLLSMPRKRPSRR